MLSVSGCASTSGIEPTAVSLEVCPAWVKPLTWSSKDTEETQIEIFSHNLKVEEFC